MQTGTAGYVFAASITGSVVFILIIAGLAMLLYRRRKLATKRDKPQGELMEMNEKTTTPKKTKVIRGYMAVSETSKAPPTAV